MLQLQQHGFYLRVLVLYLLLDVAVSHLGNETSTFYPGSKTAGAFARREDDTTLGQNTL